VSKPDLVHPSARYHLVEAAAIPAESLPPGQGYDTAPKAVPGAIRIETANNRPNDKREKRNIKRFLLPPAARHLRPFS